VSRIQSSNLHCVLACISIGHVLGHGIAVMHQSVDLIPLMNLTIIICLTCSFCRIGRVSEDLLFRGAQAMTTCSNYAADTLHHVCNVASK